MTHPLPTQTIPPQDRIPILIDIADTPGNICCNRTHDWNVFTDGSRIDGQTGCANVAKSPLYNFTNQLKLAPHCSITQAELLAIKEAVISILDHRENSQNIMINSDSQAALRFISNPVARNRLALDIRQLLGEHPDVHICFIWVRGHSGIQGNEEADLAAKGAALSSIPHSFNYAPLSYFKGKVRQELVLSWNSRWSSVAKGAATRRFIPDIGRTYRKRPLTLNTSYTIPYGHGNFNQYLHRIRKSETFNCFCGAVENPLHRLRTCPGTIRLTNAFRIRHNIGTSYYCDLIKDNCYQDFLSLCNAVNQFYTIRAGRSLNNPTSNATTIPFTSSHQLADR